MRYLLAWILVAGLAGQSVDQAGLLSLARSGKGAEAWARWKQLFPSVDRSRTGVLIAAATGEIARGLSIYEDLVKQIGREDRESMRALTVAAAGNLVAAPVEEVRIGACGVVLEAGAPPGRCQPLLDALRAPAAKPDAQVLAVYRLANSGYRPWPDLLRTFRDNMSPQVRLDIAARFTRLPVSERIDVLTPLLESTTDRPRFTAAVALLGDIPGGESLSLLQRTAERTLDLDSKIAVALALARHGDAKSAAFVQEMRSSLVGPRAVDAGVALALAGSPYGPDPKRLLETTPGPERGRLAVLLAPRMADVAANAVRGMLGDPSAPMREAGLRAAGLLGMGLDRAVYSKLDDQDPVVRLAAVDAILQTIDR